MNSRPGAVLAAGFRCSEAWVIQCASAACFELSSGVNPKWNYWYRRLFESVDKQQFGVHPKGLHIRNHLPIMTILANVLKRKYRHRASPPRGEIRRYQATLLAENERVGVVKVMPQYLKTGCRPTDVLE